MHLSLSVEVLSGTLSQSDGDGFISRCQTVLGPHCQVQEAWITNGTMQGSLLPVLVILALVAQER